MYKDLIRKRIKEKFDTIENFSKHINIPRTTINFILKNGVGVSNYDMVTRILKELEIYTIQDAPVAIDDRLLNFIKIYNSLDALGKHTVEAVAETELRRIKSSLTEETIIAAYGSLSSGKPLTDEEKTILNLVERIKDNEKHGN